MDENNTNIMANIFGRKAAVIDIHKEAAVTENALINQICVRKVVRKYDKKTFT